MAVCTVDFWGESLQKECSMVVILPGRAKRRKRPCVLYQPHGLSDNHTAWLRWTGIDRYVRELPLVVETLKMFSRGKIEIIGDYQVVDEDHHVIPGFDLTIEVDEAVKGKL